MEVWGGERCGRKWGEGKRARKREEEDGSMGRKGKEKTKGVEKNLNYG